MNLEMKFSQFSKISIRLIRQIINKTILRTPPQISCSDRFVGLITSAARNAIPRGHRKTIIPGWLEDSKESYKDYPKTGNIETGKQLLQKLDENRKREWETKMNSVNFAKSSKESLNLINKLTGKASSKNKKVYPATPDRKATQIVQSLKGVVSSAQKRKVNKQ